MTGRGVVTPVGQRRAFTLMEVLMAIAIFAVGMVAVAAIFPVAIHLQQSTVNSINATQFKNNAEAMVLTRGFSEEKISGWASGTPSTTNSNTAIAGPNTMDDGVTSPPAWSLSDRSYDGGGTVSLGDRTLFWVPLFYYDQPPSGTGTWHVYLFIVRGQTNDTYNQFSPPGLGSVAGPSIANPGTDPTGPTSKNGSGTPGVPRVESISATGAAGATTLNLDNNGPNGTHIVRPGDTILTENGNALSVVGATNSSIALEAGVQKTTNYIWAAVPSDQGNRTYAGIVGPLISQSSSKRANSSSNLVYP